MSDPTLQRDWENYLAQICEFVELRGLVCFAASEAFACFCNEIPAERAAALCVDKGARYVREDA